MNEFQGKEFTLEDVCKFVDANLEAEFAPSMEALNKEWQGKYDSVVGEYRQMLTTSMTSSAQNYNSGEPEPEADPAPAPLQFWKE